VPADDHVSSFDEAKFRQVLGHYPTGVVVVTAMAADGEPAGLAIGSFTSVSLDPPLVAFFPDKSSSSWPRIESAGTFCVNILGEDQEDVCRVFASKGTDKFASIGWRPGRTGAPVINDVIAWIECEIERIDDAGDHWIVLGRVVDLEVGHSGGPLLFFRGGYGRYEV
jgi:3-hydroxy-9,10-secoandrosta-1,3,5(10)-triene-9,17-dione monooxygenase reductase component